MEISEIIKKMCDKKSPGYEGIRMLDIKNNLQILCSIITEIIKTSINTAIVPDKMKISVIRPLYKKGKHSDYNSYRPIQILPALEKIMEKWVQIQLLQYLTVNNIITGNQYGFQKNKGTNNLLQTFTNYIHSQLNLNKHVGVVFIDYSKAFDTINHVQLLKNLKEIGLDETSVKWFKSYLSNRHAVVKVRNTYSDKEEWNTGVPQGSLLGPILYLIAVNKMPKMILSQGAKVYLFADDTAILASGNDPVTVANTLNMSFKKLQSWSHDNGLVINQDKTRVMHIRNRGQVETNFNITFHSHECLHTEVSTCTCDSKQYIQHTDTFTYLGLTIDTKFNFNQHVTNICKKMRGHVVAFYSLRRYLPYNVLKIVYYALVESIVNYGILSWGGVGKTIYDMLERSQRKILKIIVPRRFKNKIKQNIYSFTDILPFSQLHKYRLIIQQYYTQTYKKHTITTYNTRTPLTYTLPHTFNKFGERELRYLVPKIFNSLPPEIKSLNKISEVKKNVKIYLVQLKEQGGN